MSKRKTIKVCTYKPQSWTDQDKMLFVIHGGGRNADDYLDTCVELADEHNLFIIAPKFENKFSRYTTNDYQEGHLFTFFGTKNPKDEWAFSVVENVFDHIKTVNTISNTTYDIFGHSAGGQFIHRMVMLMPEARIGTAIAANAGFYTLPGDNLKYPYGVDNTGINLASELPKIYNPKLVVLLG